MEFNRRTGRVFGHFKFEVSIVAVLVLFCSYSTSVLADSSYQFSLGASGSEIDYGDGEGEAYSLSVAAYLDPITLDGSVPYNVSPFYSRTSGLFLGSSKYRVTGLNAVRGSSVLKKYDGHSSYAGLRLANDNVPFWFDFDYTRIGTSKYNFSSGTRGISYRRYIQSYTAGMFIGKALSVYGFYEDDDIDSYGVGMRYLQNLASLGFVETGFQYTEIDTERTDLEVVNGTIRNLDVQVKKENIKSFSLRYFPIVEAEIGLKYQRQDHNYDARGNYWHINAGYFITSNLRLGIGYSHMDYNFPAERLGHLEYKVLNGNVSLKF